MTDNLEQVELDAHIFANNPGDPKLMALLSMFYSGVLQNTLGVMLAKNRETGEQELLLVGVHKHEGGTDTFPVAKILGPEDVAKFAAPDGEGGWFE